MLTNKKVEAHEEALMPPVLAPGLEGESQEACEQPEGEEGIESLVQEIADSMARGGIDKAKLKLTLKRKGSGFAGVSVQAMTTAEKNSFGDPPPGYVFMQSKTSGDQWDLVPQEKAKLPTTASTMDTSEDTGSIEVGDQVFVKGLKTLGTVIRVNGGITYVETEKEKVRPCWELELEKR